MGVYKLNYGRFLLARWNDAQAQYQSSDIKAGCADQSYCYSYSRTLEGLAGVGIKTYATLAAARRALGDDYRAGDHGAE